MDSLKRRNIQNLLRVSFLALLATLPAHWASAEDDPKPAPKPRKSAYQIWSEMLESGITGREIPILIEGPGGKELPVSYGGEKEGTSTMITRLLGPNKDEFKKLAKGLGDSEKSFLAQFLSDAVSGSIIQKKVVDMNGNVVPFDVSELKGKNFSSMSKDELRAALAVYLEKLGDKHFSFVKPTVRRKIARGEYPGMGDIRWSRRTEVKNKTEPKYEDWVPHYGDAERYIQRAHSTYSSMGWELHLAPQKTYAEFEKLITWFRQTMGVGEHLFEAPGHQWIVMPGFVLDDGEIVFSNAEELKKFKDQMGEVYRNLQAYIVMKGIEGNSRIVTANHKTVQSDASLTGGSVGRGVIRLSPRDDRFTVEGVESFATEMRAGTKSDPIRRFAQTMMVSRQASRQFDDLALGSSWVLVPKSSPSVVELELERRFNVTEEEAKAAVSKLTSPKFQMKVNDSRSIGMGYLVPFWRWENAPYLSPEKKAHLKALTRNMIRSLAAAETVHGEDALRILGTWVTASSLTMDIENYLRPKVPRLADDGSLFQVAGATPAVDVNQIDLGLEYTARFPLRAQSEFRDAPSVTDRRVWVGTEYDLKPKEREEAIKNVAKVLGKKLTGSEVTVTKVDTGDHGHSLVVQYEFKDSLGRKWGVEWDGVGRDYDANGKIILGSERGGHIEVVTPKHVPTTAERNAVYDTFKQLSLVPSVRMGGGHVNFDLAAFDGKPKALARFILRFLKIRRTMALTFQHPTRLASAQPHDVSSKLEQALENFNGTEEDLKKLLYNERFFNTRLGRKSRYTQMDISAYFQDVIPPKFITQDFDIKNDLFRQTFNVEPHIRKGEFRLFNAPRTAREAEVQVKFVRAMLHEALNETGPITGKIQTVDYEGAVNNPEPVFADFEKDLKALKLDPEEFRGLFVEGIAATRDWMESELYVAYETKMKDFPKLGGWGEAVPARSKEESITSVGRLWDGSNPTVEALDLAERRRLIRVQQEALIAEFDQIRGQGVYINRYENVLPVELRYSPEEIKALGSRARMLNVIHFQLRAGKLDAGGIAYNDLMEFVISSRPEFIKAVEEVLAKRPSSGRGGEFRAWVATMIEDTPDFANAIKTAATDPNSSVRIRVWDFVKAMSDKRIAEIARDLDFNDVGLRRHWLEEMATRSFTEGEPIFAKKDPKSLGRKILDLLMMGTAKDEAPQLLGYTPVDLKFLIRHAAKIFDDPKMFEDRALMTQIFLKMPVKDRQAFAVSLLKSTNLQVRRYGIKLMEGMDPFDGETMKLIGEIQKEKARWDKETKEAMAKLFKESNERVRATTLEQFRALDTRKALAYAFHLDRADWVAELRSRDSLDEFIEWSMKTYPENMKLQAWMARQLLPAYSKSLAYAVRSASKEARQSAFAVLKGLDTQKALAIINATLEDGAPSDPQATGEILEFVDSLDIDGIEISDYPRILGQYRSIFGGKGQTANFGAFVRVVSRFKDSKGEVNQVAMWMYRQTGSYKSAKNFGLVLLSKKMDPVNYEIFHRLQGDSNRTISAMARTYVISYQTHLDEMTRRGRKQQTREAQIQILFEKSPKDEKEITRVLGKFDERSSLLVAELERTAEDTSARGARYREWLLNLYHPMTAENFIRLAREPLLLKEVLNKTRQLAPNEIYKFVAQLEWVLSGKQMVPMLPWLVEVMEEYSVTQDQTLFRGIRMFLGRTSKHVQTQEARRAYFRLMKYIDDTEALKLAKDIAEDSATPAPMLRALIITMKYRKNDEIRDWVRTFAVHPDLQIQSIVNSWIAVQDALAAEAEAARRDPPQTGTSCAEQLLDSPL